MECDAVETARSLIHIRGSGQCDRRIHGTYHGGDGSAPIAS